jgi:hypothetical protein
MMPPANRVSRRSRKIISPGGGEAGIDAGAFVFVDAEAFALGAALAAALARLFFDIGRFQIAGEVPAININFRNLQAARKALSKHGITEDIPCPLK